MIDLQNVPSVYTETTSEPSAIIKPPIDLLGAPVEVRDGMGGHHRANALREEWLTPPHVLSRLGNFDLDPCAPIARPWATAVHHFTIKDNGLVQPWAGRVFCNPPYGPETGKLMARMRDHGNGVALVFARVETRDWQREVWPHASGILFLAGRLTFFTTEGKPAAHNGGAPSALIAYGERNAKCLATCGLEGAYVDLVKMVGSPTC